MRPQAPCVQLKGAVTLVAIKDCHLPSVFPEADGTIVGPVRLLRGQSMEVYHAVIFYNSGRDVYFNSTWPKGPRRWASLSCVRLFTKKQVANA